MKIKTQLHKNVKYLRNISCSHNGNLTRRPNRPYIYLIVHSSSISSFSPCSRHEVRPMNDPSLPHDCIHPVVYLMDIQVIFFFRQVDSQEVVFCICVQNLVILFYNFTPHDKLNRVIKSISVTIR